MMKLQVGHRATIHLLETVDETTSRGRDLPFALLGQSTSDHAVEVWCQAVTYRLHK